MADVSKPPEAAPAAVDKATPPVPASASAPATAPATVTATLVQAAEKLAVETATAVVKDIEKKSTGDLKTIEKDLSQEAAADIKDGLPSLSEIGGDIVDGIQTIGEELVEGAEVAVEAVKAHPELIAEAAVAVGIGVASIVQPELVVGSVAMIGKMAADSAKKTASDIAVTASTHVVNELGKDLTEDVIKDAKTVLATSTKTDVTKEETKVNAEKGTVVTTETKSSLKDIKIIATGVPQTAIDAIEDAAKDPNNKSVETVKPEKVSEEKAVSAATGDKATTTAADPVKNEVRSEEKEGTSVIITGDNDKKVSVKISEDGTITIGTTSATVEKETVTETKITTPEIVKEEKSEKKPAEKTEEVTKETEKKTEDKSSQKAEGVQEVEKKSEKEEVPVAKEGKEATTEITIISTSKATVEKMELSKEVVVEPKVEESTEESKTAKVVAKEAASEIGKPAQVKIVEGSTVAPAIVVAKAEVPVEVPVTQSKEQVKEPASEVEKPAATESLVVIENSDAKAPAPIEKSIIVTKEPEAPTQEAEKPKESVPVGPITPKKDVNVLAVPQSDTHEILTKIHQKLDTLASNSVPLEPTPSKEIDEPVTSPADIQTHDSLAQIHQKLDALLASHQKAQEVAANAPKEDQEQKVTQEDLKQIHLKLDKMHEALTAQPTTDSGESFDNVHKRLETIHEAILTNNKAQEITAKSLAEPDPSFGNLHKRLDALSETILTNANTQKSILAAQAEIKEPAITPDPATATSLEELHLKFSTMQSTLDKLTSTLESKLQAPPAPVSEPEPPAPSQTIEIPTTSQPEITDPSNGNSVPQEAPPAPTAVEPPTTSEPPSTSEPAEALPTTTTTDTAKDTSVSEATGEETKPSEPPAKPPTKHVKRSSFFGGFFG